MFWRLPGAFSHRPWLVCRFREEYQSPIVGFGSAFLRMILCLMLYKRFASSVLLLHQACQSLRQRLHQIVILGGLCVPEPCFHLEALLAHFAVLPPEAITFLARLSRHLLRDLKPLSRCYFAT